MEYPVLRTAVDDKRGANKRAFRLAKRAGTRVENEPPDEFAGIVLL
jgi:hypothetical protein